MNRPLMLALAVMVGLLGYMYSVRFSVGRDLDGRYANSPNKEWFESQRNSAGMWCCNESDGHLYYGDYKINEDGSVTADGQKIEDFKVLKGSNPTGTAVWWYVDTPYGRTTYCFSPGPMT